MFPFQASQSETKHPNDEKVLERRSSTVYQAQGRSGSFFTANVSFSSFSAPHEIKEKSLDHVTPPGFTSAPVKSSEPSSALVFIERHMPRCVVGLDTITEIPQQNRCLLNGHFYDRQQLEQLFTGDKYLVKDPINPNLSFSKANIITELSDLNWLIECFNVLHTEHVKLQQAYQKLQQADQENSLLKKQYSQQKTALQASFRTAVESNNLPLLQILCGTDIDFQLPVKNNLSPLIYAVLSGEWEMVKLFIYYAEEFNKEVLREAVERLATAKKFDLIILLLQQLNNDVFNNYYYSLLSTADYVVNEQKPDFGFIDQLIYKSVPVSELLAKASKAQNNLVIWYLLSPPYDKQLHCKMPEVVEATTILAKSVSPQQILTQAVEKNVTVVIQNILPKFATNQTPKREDWDLIEKATDFLIKTDNSIDTTVLARIPSEFLLDDKRKIAIKLFDYCLAKSQTPIEVITLVETLWQMKKDLSYLTDRQGKFSYYSFTDHIWDGVKVSETWSKLIKKAKERITQLAKNPLYQDSQKVRDFVGGMVVSGNTDNSALTSYDDALKSRNADQLDALDLLQAQSLMIGISTIGLRN